MNAWVAILAGGLITFLMRLSFIQLMGRFEVPEGTKRALRLVPPAVLSAIVLPELLVPTGGFDLSLHNYRLLAGCAAVLVAWKTRNTLLTILVGMIVLFLLPVAF
jgi:branched-subunit amino acid transport protein